MLLYLAGLAVVAAVAVLVAAPLLRGRVEASPAPPADSERYRLEKEKELAYAAIKEAEFDFQMGKLSAEDYAALREKYEARALRALAALEPRAPTALAQHALALEQHAPSGRERRD